MFPNPNQSLKYKSLFQSQIKNNDLKLYFRIKYLFRAHVRLKF